MTQFRYAEVQKGRHIVQHLLSSAHVIVQALPTNGVGPAVAEFSAATGEARYLLNGKRDFPRRAQIESINGAIEKVAEAKTALATIIEAHSEDEGEAALLKDAASVLDKATGHLEALLTFVTERRQPYSGEPRSYFPGEGEAEAHIPEDDIEDGFEDDES